MTTTNKITITDRFIWGLINSYTTNDKPFYAGNSYLAKELSISSSTISHSISRLLKDGYIINKGDKYSRLLYTNKKLLSADICNSNADICNSNATCCIYFDKLKGVIAKNSAYEMQKTAIASADNCNILLSILSSITNKGKENKLPPNGTTQPKKKLVPDNYRPSPSTLAKLKERGYSDSEVEDNIENFINSCKAKNYLYVNFDAALLKWYPKKQLSRVKQMRELLKKRLPERQIACYDDDRAEEMFYLFFNDNDLNGGDNGLQKANTR